MSGTRSAPSTPGASLSPLTSLAPYSTTSTPRLQALYSDFSRQKHSNPTSYHSNVDWWRNALETVVASGLQTDSMAAPQTPGRRQEDAILPSSATTPTTTKSDRLVLHAGRELMERVKIPKVGKPLALGAVLFELRSTRTVATLADFLTAKVSLYDPGWLPARIAAYVVGKPLWWALEQMGVVGEEGFLGSGSRQHRHNDTSWWGDYIFVPLVEKAADAVMERQEERMAGPGDALYSLESFRTVFAGVAGGEENATLRELDTKVLVKFLERERGVIVVDKETIKFVDKDAPVEERRITAVDRGIVELKNAIRNLQAQVEALQSKIEECTRKASSALQKKRKPAALGYIRSRKQLEDLLQKRLGSLGTLESTFITVEAAAGDVEIMKSYESSTATLRAILAHPSLERSSIDKTMEALADANADARDVDDAVRIGGNIALGVEDAIDDDELEEEWKAMVREAEAESASKGLDAVGSKLGDISKTPTTSPMNEPKLKAQAIAAS
ncbi:hypothetical protein GALMADRAFT_251201 [Galerina marginata CBS 339.88]|uniref:Charged multivesicular body protein 7 n=1 Tax=Galerina marginata (strain CBS 339.88) TaxID=685588 RepID=A0A067T3C3_GALM3|nr:hypothetical protein GALMADRAFT_251201 [Galerina marginata CBS 339.88]